MVLRIAGIFAFIFLPVCVGIKWKYRTYDKEYAWEFSMAFVSGKGAAAVCFVVWTLFIIFIFFQLCEVEKNCVHIDTVKENEKINSTYTVDDQSLLTENQQLNPLSCSTTLQTPSIESSENISPQKNFIRESRPSISLGTSESIPLPSTSNNHFDRWDWLIWGMIVMVDLILVGAVNIGFVYLTLEASSTLITVGEIGMGLFKLCWKKILFADLHMLIRRKLYLKSNALSSSHFKEVNHNEMLFINKQAEFDAIQRNSIQVLIMLINLVVIPCLSIALFSSSCYYNILVPPKLVTGSTSYKFDQCIAFDIDSNTCKTSTPSSHSSSFQPPFIYSYQCSSTLVRNYASAFVYMFFFSGFVQPLVFSLARKMMASKSWKNISFLQSIAAIFPKFLFLGNSDIVLPCDAECSNFHHSFYCRHHTVPIFLSDKHIADIIGNIAVLVTFGAVFPLLGIVISVAILLDSYWLQFTIGKSLLNARNRKFENYGDVLNRNCGNFREHFRTVVRWLIIYLCCMFYAFFIFDSYGDDVGYLQALPLAIVTAGFPFLFWISRCAIKQCCGFISFFNSNRSTKKKQKQHNAPTSHNFSPLPDSEPDSIDHKDFTEPESFDTVAMRIPDKHFENDRQEEETHALFGSLNDFQLPLNQ